VSKFAPNAGMMSYEKGMVMAPTARVIGVSLLTGVLVAGFTIKVYGQYSDYVLPMFFGFIGGIIGAVAGAAREIATAVRQRHEN
jgi:hypothetical protein